MLRNVMRSFEPRALDPSSGEPGTFQLRIAEVGALEMRPLEHRLPRHGCVEHCVSCRRAPQGRAGQVGVEQVRLGEVNRYGQAKATRLPIPSTAKPWQTPAPSNEQSQARVRYGGSRPFAQVGPAQIALLQVCPAKA